MMRLAMVVPFVLGVSSPSAWRWRILSPEDRRGRRRVLGIPVRPWPVLVMAAAGGHNSTMPSTSASDTPCPQDITLAKPGLWAFGNGQLPQTGTGRPGPADQPVRTAGRPRW